MDPLQLWVEGYKARGESCKQGGIVASVLIAFLGASGKVTGISSFGFWAAFAFAFAVGFSALAWLFIGMSITKASERLVEEAKEKEKEKAEAKKAKAEAKTTSLAEGAAVDPATIVEAETTSPPEGATVDPATILSVDYVKTSNGGLLKTANIVGIFEIVFLGVGLVLTLFAVS